MLKELKTERKKMVVRLAHVRAIGTATKEGSGAIVADQLNTLISLGRFEAEINAKDMSGPFASLARC